jgi:FlaA1/EpsC-like NDP-sugar epimerase
LKANTITRNRYFLIGDILLIALSVFASFLLKFELGPDLYTYLPGMFWMIGAALIIKPLIYYEFGLYRKMWVYASIQELRLIVIAVTAASIPVGLAVVGMFYLGLFHGFPRMAILIDWALSLIFVGGLRLSARLLAENRKLNLRANFPSRARNILVIGAGDAGALVVRELQRNPQLNLTPVGFLDDDPAKQNQQIHNIPVIGTLDSLSATLNNLAVNEVIIAIPSAPGRVVRKVTEVCRLKNIPFRTMPGIYELLGGKVSVSRLREVDISDLLRREPTHMREEQIGTTLSGRVVMITGAGGSIGRELCRQIARWSPSELLLLGHGENSLYETYLELQESFSTLPTQILIADVRDYNRLENLFTRHNPQIVFHAAAHKHVPLMEANAEEAVTNNVLGTRNIVNLCQTHKFERLVMISTDKAIRPINMLGATKRLAEMIVLDAARTSGKAFSVVRFGNVLGSRGSVVPLFKRQIAHGGPVTITHPDMKRYFMTIPEAVYLVLQAASLGEGGETFILNMGEQVRILDLAEDLIRLSGLEPGKDIEIVFTGIRPGDKLSEDLWDEGHQFKPTAHPDVFRSEHEIILSSKILASTTDELIRLAGEGDTQTIFTILDEVIPGAAIRATPPPEINAIE